MPEWLSPEQRAKVNKNRKGTRPSYYNSQTRTRVPIDEDTEAALILLSGEIKNQAAQYLQQFLDNQNKDKAYADLLEDFSSFQSNIAEWAALEMDIIFAGFNSFKTQLMGSGEKVFATGIQPVLKALNIGLGGIKRKKEAQTYNRIHMTSAANMPSYELSLDQKKEIASWIPVLSLY